MNKKVANHILLQVLKWCTGWLILLLIMNKTNEFGAHFWRRVIITLVGISIVVFVNLKWLLPYFYLKNKKSLYILACLVLIAILVWSMHSDLLWWNQKDRFGIDVVYDNSNINNKYDVWELKKGNNFRWLIRNLPSLFIPLLGSSLIAISRYASEKEKESIRLEKSKLETEVKFLKSQINPHFLFNSLHNIYALSIIRSDQTSEQILKLSDILRYMLYDSNAEKVPIQREIDYLKNYLGMAQLKDSRGMDISFDISGTNTEISIAPLLFIPFVENAFKHSQIENFDSGFIHINLKTKDKTLYFVVENSKPKRAYNKDQVGGIGISNIQKRLQLLYPNKHQLKIEESVDKFNVNLELNLS